MVSRAVIERAKGILMQGQVLTVSQSFDVLTHYPSATAASCMTSLSASPVGP
jgi:hypothetical protein